MLAFEHVFALWDLAFKKDFLKQSKVSWNVFESEYFCNIVTWD